MLNLLQANVVVHHEFQHGHQNQDQSHDHAIINRGPEYEKDYGGRMSSTA